MSDSADTVTTRLIARVKHGAEEEWTLGGSIASSAGTLNTEKTLASYVKVTDGVRKVQMKSSFTESGFRPQVFSFNRCFSQGTSQADFFGGCGAINSLDRLLRSSNLGSEDSSQVDFCVLAYGQTGAGKTHTMFGAGPLTGPPINHSHIDAAVEENYDTEIQEKDPHSQPEDGLIVRSIEYLFLQLLHTSSVVHNFHLKLSCLEICDDIVLDLFSGSNLPVHIKENVSEGYSVSGCQFIDCTSFESAAAAIELVARHRRGRYAPNSLHSPLKDSDIHHGVHKVDRSHCIVEVCVCVPMLVGDGAFSEFNSGIATPANELADNGMNGAYLHNGPASPRFITRAKVTFVDLAGSERLRSEPKVDTKSTNKPASEASAKESRAINPSLYVLGKVIAGLVRAKGDIYADDVPFHESVLTKLLIQPLSRGNILRSNLFIACIDDSPRCEYETLRTLKFATSCVQLRSRAALGLPKMSKQDKLISELKLSIKKVKEDNQEMRRTILATPSYGDKILAHCDEDTLESSAAFANAPPKMKPKIKDVKKPVSLSEKKRTWASWKLFESNSKAKTAVINVHQNHLPIANLLTSGSRVYPMAGPTLNGQFPAHNMSQSTVRGGSPLRSTTAPQGSTAEDEDFGLGFYNDEEREEMLLKKLADGMSASAQSKPRPSSSPNEKTSFQPSALFGSVTMSNVSGVSGGESHMDRGSHFSKTGPLPRGKSARPGQPTSGVESRGHGHSQEQTAKYENHMAEKRMAAQMKKRVLDECRKKNHQPISPYLGHFVPKRVIHDRPTFEVPLLHDIVPLHASIHQDEPMSEEEAHKLKGASTSGELRDGSHSRTHTPSKTHSGGKSRSASRSPSRSRPGSTHKKRTAHGSPGSAERPGSRGRRGLSGKIRSPEVMALEKAIQPHSMMFDLLDAEYRHFGRDDDEIANNPSSLVDRILPTTAEKAVLENHSFSPRVEPLDLSVSGTGLSPQQKMALKEEKPVEAEVEEDADYDSYDEQFEAEEEPVEVPAVQVETAPEAPAEKVQADDAVASAETLTTSEESAVETLPVVTWSPSTKNKNDETPRSLSPTASIESATSKSPSHSSYPLPTTVILAQAQQGIHIIAEPSTPGFLSPSGRSQKAAHYAPQPASPVITSPKEVKHTWENEAVLLMAPVFAASEERQMEERQESFIQRMTMSSKGGFSDSVSSRDAFIPRVSSHDEEEENYEDEKYEFDAEDEEEPAPAESVVAGIALQDESPAPGAEQEKEPAAATDVVHDEEEVEASPLEAYVDADATPAPAVEPAPTQDSYEDYDEEFEDAEVTSRKEGETALPEAEPVESSSIEGAVDAEPAVDFSKERDEVVLDSAPITSEGSDTESTDVPQTVVLAGETAEEGTAALAETLADGVATEEKEEVGLPTVESPAAVPAMEEQEDEYEMEFNEDDEETQPVSLLPDVTEPEVATSQEETVEGPTDAPAAVDSTEQGEVAVVAPIATDESQAAADVPSQDEPAPVEEPSEHEPAVVEETSEQEAAVESAPVEPETVSNKYEEDAYEEEFEAEVEAEAGTQASADAALVEVPADAAAEQPVDVDETVAAAALPDDATESQEERVPDVVEETTVRAKPALVPPPANFEAFASEFSAGAVNRAVARIASRDDALPAIAAQDALTAEVLAASAVSEVLSRFTPREPEPEPATEQNVIDVLDLPLSPVHMLGDIDPVHHISATTMSEPFHLLDDFSEYDISWEMSPSPDAKGHGIAESEAESVKVSGAAQRPVTEAVEPASSEEHVVTDAVDESIPVVCEAAEAAEVAEVVTEDVKSIETEEPAVPAVPVRPDVDVQAEETPVSYPKPAFTTGSRVQCNDHASGDWYAGVVASTNTDGTHNIDYDDGDKETNVSADMIRLETAEAEADSADSTSQSAAFVVGAKVDANYRGKGRWYSGTVSRVRETGTYDIDYDDGEKEIHVEADLLRAVIPFTREDTATALFMDDLLVLQKEQEAEPVNEQPKIAAVETTVVVDTLSESEAEPAVEVVPATQEEPSQAATSLVAGARVEGNYRASGVWYPGVLARVHADGSGDINYDDGEVEAYVPAGLIRAEQVKETTVVVEVSSAESAVEIAPTVATDSPSFVVGERVEAKYHGKKRWYAGVVSQVHASNTFDIDYDDGEKEIGVVAENIRSAIVAVEEDPAVTELMDELVGELGVPSSVAVPSAPQAGVRVEGNYRASGVWYPGVLARVHADGSGDINYDDGEVEAYVPAGLIRAEKLTTVEPVACQIVTAFEVGTQIEGNYRGKGRWYPGVIARVREVGAYDIDYDDGEKETHVEADLVRLAITAAEGPGIVDAATAALQAGARVEGNYRASGVWYPGVLARVHADGSGDINYDDGEVEAYVPAGLIRAEETAAIISADLTPEPAPEAVVEPTVEVAVLGTADAIITGPTFSVGSRVEGNYRGKGRWYPGTVSRVRDSGTYDIDYDGGEKETHVVEEELIPLGDVVSTKVATPALQAGTRVEGNYRASGVWYPGVLARIHADGSGDINYDDGEVEAYVPAGLIRAEVTHIVSVEVAPEAAAGEPSTVEYTEEEETPAPAEDTAESGPAVGEDESAPHEQNDSNAVEEKADPEPTVSPEAMPVVEAAAEPAPETDAIEPAPETDAIEPAETVASSEEDLAVKPEASPSLEDEEIAHPSEVPSVSFVEGDTQAAIEPEHVDEAVSSETAADGEISVGETGESVAEPVADAGVEGAESVQGAPEEEKQRVEVEAAVENAGTPAANTEPAPVVERSVPVDEPSSDAVDEAAVDALVASTVEPSPAARAEDDEEVIAVPVVEESVVESEPQQSDVFAAVDESTSLPAVGDVDAVNTDEPSTTELVAEAVKAVESELVETSDDVAAPADTTDTTDTEPASGAAIESAIESLAESANEDATAEAAEKEVQSSPDEGAVVEENAEGQPDAAQAEEVILVASQSEEAVEETLADLGDQEATEQPTEDVSNEETCSVDHIATETAEVAEPGNAVAETVAAVEDPSSVVEVDEEAIVEAAPAPAPVEEELAPAAVTESEEPAVTGDENENDPREGSAAPVQPSDDIADIREEEPPAPELVLEAAVESSGVVDEPLSVEPVGQDAAGDVQEAAVGAGAADVPSSVEGDVLVSTSAEEPPSTERFAEADSAVSETAPALEEPSSVDEVEGEAAIEAGEQTGRSDSAEQPDTISDVPAVQGDAGDSTAEETIDTLNEESPVTEPIDEAKKVMDESDLGDSAAAQEDVVVEEVDVDTSAPEISSSAEDDVVFSTRAEEPAPTEPVGEAVEHVLADAVPEVSDDSADPAVEIADEQLATEAEATETVAAVAELEHVAAEPVAVVVAEAAVDEEAADPSGGVTVLVADPVLPEPEPAAPRVIEKGSRIEGNYRGKGAWIPGQVVRMHNNGSADINYQNGEMEAFVPPAWMRLTEEEKVVDTVVPEPVEQPAAVDASVLEQPEDTPANDDAVEVAPVGADPSEEEVLEVVAPVGPAAVDVAELVLDNAPSEGFLPAGETAIVNEELVSPTEVTATAQQGETEESVQEEPAVKQAEPIEEATPDEVEEPTEDAVAPLAQSTGDVMSVVSQVDASPVTVEGSVIDAAPEESAEPTASATDDNNDNQVVEEAAVAAEGTVLGEESLAEAVGSTEMDVVLSQPAETTMPAETAGGAPAESEKESTVAAEEGVPLAEVGAAEANAHNFAATVEVAEAVSAEDAVEVLAEETPAVEVEPAVAVEENKIETVDVAETTPLVESAEQPTTEEPVESNEDAPAVVEESVEQTEPTPAVHVAEEENASIPVVEAEPDVVRGAAGQEAEGSGLPVEEDAPVESVVQKEVTATDAEAVEQVEPSTVDALPTNAAAAEELVQAADTPEASADGPVDTPADGPVDTVDVAELSVPEASTECNPASQPIEEPEASPVSVEDSPDPVPTNNVTTATKAENTGMSKKLAPQMSENLFEVDFSELGSVKQPPNTTTLNKTDGGESPLSSAELAALALSVGSADEGDAQASEAQNDTDSVELKQEVNRASAESKSRKSTKSGKSAGDDDEGLFDVDFE